MSGWTVIVPAKPWHLAKSRLRTVRRADLARAFLLDVLDVVAATDGVGRVVVVSAETGLAAEARRRDVALMADRPLGTPGRLNTAVSIGRRWAFAHAPCEPVAVVPADLPCLDPVALATTLAALGEHDRAFVPDLARGGTTLVSAATAGRLRTAYGTGSAARHQRLGLRRVEDVPLVVRRDVDTLEDLADALELGVGGHTLDAARPALSAAG
ncbi:2-phospho-L-lactate guanylyltransferase [Aeromicrobium sp. Leaf350]|uniref:2-phospho-L-lactate guanylyltransferase n=1 Tax=Aeromicrobium sp. Leaf350 TaxID=2876565 RepID=UPI001E3E4784|nr:2-phospho-L-lactate guanylyltransferase [Aeromicrobium sp. Leaf350]